MEIILITILIFGVIVGCIFLIIERRSSDGMSKQQLLKEWKREGLVPYTLSSGEIGAYNPKYSAPPIEKVYVGSREQAREEYEFTRSLTDNYGVPYELHVASGTYAEYIEPWDVSGTVISFDPYLRPIKETATVTGMFPRRCKYCGIVLFEKDRYCVACGAPA